MEKFGKQPREWGYLVRMGVPMIRRLVLLGLPLMTAVLAIGVAQDATAQNDDPTAHPIKLSFSATAPVYQLGSDIQITLTATNQTDQQNSFFAVKARDQGRAYHLEVSSLDTGEKVARTRFGKALAQASWRGGTDADLAGFTNTVEYLGIYLKPHETRTYTIDLSRQFDFKEPGKYKVETIHDFNPVPVDPIEITVR